MTMSARVTNLGGMIVAEKTGGRAKLKVPLVGATVI